MNTSGFHRITPSRTGAVIKRGIAERVISHPDSVHGPDGWASDIPAPPAPPTKKPSWPQVESTRRSGVGTDGHIGFNEPIRPWPRSPESRRSPNRPARTTRFDDDLAQVPTHVLTQGVGTILRAGHLVLLAWGENKAEAVRDTVKARVTSMIPSTALQLHPHATVVVDEAAASALANRDHYKLDVRQQTSVAGL